MQNENKKPKSCKIFEILQYIGIKMLEFSGSKTLVVIGILSLLSITFFVKRIAIVATVMVILFYSMIFISYGKEILLTLRGFLFTGTLYWVIITVLLKNFINNVFGTSTIWLDYLFILLSWCFYSLLANNKVATVANQIYSTILGLLAIMKDIIIYSIPETFLNRVDASGETYGRIIEISIGKILYPVLAINLMALLLCSLKGYWIAKYNDGKDLEDPKKINQDETDLTKNV